MESECPCKRRSHEPHRYRSGSPCHDRETKYQAKKREGTAASFTIKSKGANGALVRDLYKSKNAKSPAETGPYGVSNGGRDRD